MPHWFILFWLALQQTLHDDLHITTRILELFHGNPDTVTGMYAMSFGNIDVEPETTGIVLRGILGHQAVLVIVDVGDKFDASLNLKKFFHKKGGEYG